MLWCEQTTYSFYRSANHYLQEHIVQWHPTILARIALVSQRLMNSYSVDVGLIKSMEKDGLETQNALFQDGDLLVHFHGCGSTPKRDCEREMKPYYEDWERVVRRLDGKQTL